MKGLPWSAAALMLSLSLSTSALGGARPTGTNHASASGGAASTQPNAAPAPKAPSSANEARGASSSSPYPLITVSVNGKQLATQGMLINGRTLLPIIDLVEKLGGKAMWDAQSKTVWAAFPRQKRTLRLVVGAPKATIYRYSRKDPHRTGSLIATTTMDQPPMLLGGYVLAPADAAANIVRAKVFFKPETKQVSIVSPSRKQTASR
jgi:Copper amine oxidase N-terminal domain